MNGKENDFVVAEVRSYSGHPKIIRNFYRSMQVAVPYDANGNLQFGKKGTQSVLIAFLPSPLPPHYGWKFGYEPAWDLSQLAGRENLYVVEG